MRQSRAASCIQSKACSPWHVVDQPIISCYQRHVVQGSNQIALSYSRRVMEPTNRVLSFACVVFLAQRVSGVPRLADPGRNSLDCSLLDAPCSDLYLYPLVPTWSDLRSPRRACRGASTTYRDSQVMFRMVNHSTLPFTEGQHVTQLPVCQQTLSRTPQSFAASI